MSMGPITASSDWSLKIWLANRGEATEPFRVRSYAAAKSLRLSSSKI